MPVKDYYKILEVPHNASDQEIKKAYRQMAMKYHPDKNEGNKLAENQFREVLEAYEILSNPGRRSAYNQQRWYRQSNRKQPDNPTITSYSIHNKCRALNRYMQTLDPFHINRQALNHYLVQLLSDSTLTILLTENNHSNNQLIINEILKSLSPLSFRASAASGLFWKDLPVTTSRLLT